MPIAAVINGQIYAVHSDHLNTPRRLTDSTGQPVWQWAYSAFGNEKPTLANTRFANLDINPSPGTTNISPVVFNVRYPGQYDDVESGLSQNRHRFYDRRTGRYTQTDPIGLGGGWNPYPYANLNSLRFTDPFGLSPVMLMGPGAGTAGGLGSLGMVDRLGGATGGSNLSGGYDPRTDMYTPPQGGYSLPGWLKGWLTPSSALSRCEAQCGAQNERDMAECKAYSGMTGDKYTYVACKRNADKRYSQCMADCGKDCK